MVPARLGSIVNATSEEEADGDESVAPPLEEAQPARAREATAATVPSWASRESFTM
jgi:hypothetical protein